MKIIFLDIDGVLHPAQSHDHLQIRQVWALNRIIEHTDARIVVISTWRLKYTRAELREVFADAAVDGVIIGFTPDHRTDTTPRWQPLLRGQEIESWLASRPDVTHWVILDDIACHNPMNSRQILIDGEVGLTRDNADCAIELLLA